MTAAHGELADLISFEIDLDALGPADSLFQPKFAHDLASLSVPGSQTPYLIERSP